MRALIWIVLLFALAVGFSLAGKFDPGYAVLVYPPYRIELSLTLLVIVFLLLLVVGHLFFRLASATLRLPETVRVYRLQQRAAAVRDAQDAAGTALLEGRYAQAEKLVVDAMNKEVVSWQALLVAAQAAHEAQAYDRRDAYLTQAGQLAPSQALAVHVVRARCLLNQQLASAALVEIAQAKKLDPDNAGLNLLEQRAQVLINNNGIA
jgi:HemY protein